MKYIIAYDIGTTGLKTCLFKVDKKIELIECASKGYPLYILENGGAEQDTEDWWNAMCETTKNILEKTKIDKELIEGISFCSQAQGLILVDKDGNALRRPMSYMDQRAKEEIKKGIQYGPKIAGANIFKLIPSLIITGAVTSSVKDPVWKYKWVEAHEKDIYSRIYKWLDVKDYLILRCTSKFTMTEDSAYATLIYNPNKKCFSKKMCSMFDINMNHLPDVIKSTDLVGTLTEKSSKELGLSTKCKVFGGGGDSSLIGVGAGTTRINDTHIYSGTSGWVITVTNSLKVDAANMIAAIQGAESGKYNYFAEMETAGKCLEWVKDHLALDEIGIYLNKKEITEDYEGKSISLYDYLTETIKDIPIGSNGVIFTPWLHGNRCPFEDPNSLGMFIGIKLETGKTELIRSVLEGIFYHLRWMLECQEKKLDIKDTIRFVGGGALSKVSCQMLSDIIGKKIETVKSPQNVGAVGACAIAAIGLKEISNLDSVSDFIEVEYTFEPNMENHKKYEPYYQTFKKLYKANKNIFKELSNTNNK